MASPVKITAQRRLSMALTKESYAVIAGWRCRNCIQARPGTINLTTPRALSSLVRGTAYNHSQNIAGSSEIRFTSVSSLPITQKRAFSASSTRATQSPPPPPWLASILDDHTPPPRIYSWTPEGLPLPQSLDSRTDDDVRRRIYILGVGNIGRLYASYLANSPSPPPVTLVVHREELLHQWHAGEGIQIRRPDGRMLVDKKAFDVEYWTSSPPSSSSSGQARELVPGSICNLIVATKASAALSEADRLRRYLDARSVVGFAQNGMSRLWPPHGPAYIAHRYASADAAPREHPSFVGCLTSHGIFSLGPFSSQHAGIADAKVGLVLPGGGRPGASEAAARAADYFMRTIAGATLLDSEYITPADLWVRQLEKLHINSVINTLSAILRVKNGLLFTGPGSDQLARLMEQMTAETSCVFRALVAHPSTADILLSSSSTSSPTAGEDAAERLATARRALDERFAEAPLRRILWTVSEKVAENTSSMLQDVRAGRQTEVREFNGWLVDTARSLREGVSTTSSNNDRHHLDTSTHETLVSLVESGVVRTPEDLARELLTK